MENLLYGSKGSGSAAIEAALGLARVPCRVVETATWERNAAYDDLLKVNPLGQVPTLVLPDGTAVSESAAILIHLGLAHPASGLIPADASSRARAPRPRLPRRELLCGDRRHRLSRALDPPA